MIINFDYVYHHLLSRINVLMCLNNQREIEIEMEKFVTKVLYNLNPWPGPLGTR
jgi:hypothetical protein